MSNKDTGKTINTTGSTGLGRWLQGTPFSGHGEKWDTLTPSERRMLVAKTALSALALVGTVMALAPQTEVVGHTPAATVAHEPGVYKWHVARDQVDAAQADAANAVDAGMLTEARQKFNLNTVVDEVEIVEADGGRLQYAAPGVRVEQTNSWAGKALGNSGRVTIRVDEGP